jgi:hypothetical protein
MFAGKDALDTQIAVPQEELSLLLGDHSVTASCADAIRHCLAQTLSKILRLTDVAPLLCTEAEEMRIVCVNLRVRSIRYDSAGTSHHL